MTDTHRRVEITNVRAVVATDIQLVDGLYRRAVRILGEPVTNETPTEILEVIVNSDERADLEITAPEQRF